MNKWTPLNNYHQKPKPSELIILSDGKDIFYDMVWIDCFSHDGKRYESGWYHVNGTEPMNIKFTHWMVLELPK